MKYKWTNKTKGPWGISTGLNNHLAKHAKKHINPWLIHVNVWQKPLQYCKVISLQLIKINFKKRKKRRRNAFYNSFLQTQFKQFQPCSWNSSKIPSWIFPEIMLGTIYNGSLLTLLGTGFIVTLARLGNMWPSSP